jgi:hypothetical protein
VKPVDEIEEQRGRHDDANDQKLPVMAQALRMLEDDALDDVGHVLAAIGGGLQQLVDLLPLDDGDRPPSLP